ncbi:hypothetical protein OGAPHI_001741 [Ogataea philodendri]|uniref:Uncharacterized protein n=1 Tax=Ogataea philodendri TaxID=1378263 RepID=A0A9P8P9W8_9ASCO|nr:uncharacterized protein OGAPHI_001741 [Ogataea philodendri]KAH3667987.1 hypothetical protein OGAPHI_001741 [Ogataea philodendri]
MLLSRLLQSSFSFRTTSSTERHTFSISSLGMRITTRPLLYRSGSFLYRGESPNLKKWTLDSPVVSGGSVDSNSSSQLSRIFNSCLVFHTLSMTRFRNLPPSSSFLEANSPQTFQTEFRCSLLGFCTSNASNCVLDSDSTPKLVMIFELAGKTVTFARLGESGLLLMLFIVSFSLNDRKLKLGNGSTWSRYNDPVSSLSWALALSFLLNSRDNDRRSPFFSCFVSCTTRFSSLPSFANSCSNICWIGSGLSETFCSCLLSGRLIVR